MAIIWMINKKGKMIKTPVKETVGVIWGKMNGNYDPNVSYNFANKDYMLLTDKKGSSLIFNKRYMWKTTEK